MKYCCEARSYSGVWHGVVYHVSNLDECEVIDYKSDAGYYSESDAFDNASNWAEENNIDAETY